MANIFNAIINVAPQDGKVTLQRGERIQKYLMDNVAYGGALEAQDNFDEELDSTSFYMDVKWSLDYIKDYLIAMCKDLNVSIEARGEEEGLGFYEVIHISHTGEIIKHEELSF